LRGFGVKGILIKAAEQGYITQLECKMPKCFCPEELGGASYFEPVTDAHRLCNRIDYSIQVGSPHAKDLERVRKAREEAIRRNNEIP
jgi:hypothetical protein